MPRSKINFDAVRKIGLALPGVEENTAYGTPALKVRGKLLACVPVHRSAEPGSLAVRVGFDDRAELLAAFPPGKCQVTYDSAINRGEDLTVFCFKHPSHKIAAMPLVLRPLEH